MPRSYSNQPYEDDPQSSEEAANNIEQWEQEEAFKRLHQRHRIEKLLTRRATIQRIKNNILWIASIIVIALMLTSGSWLGALLDGR